MERVPEWNWAIDTSRKITEGPPAVGAVYEQTRTVPPAWTDQLEITNVDPTKRIDVAGSVSHMPARITYELTRRQWGTRLVNTIRLKPRGLLRLVSPLAARRIAAGVADNLKVLRRRLESRPSTT